MPWNSDTKVLNRKGDGLHEFLVHYVRPGKARAIFAADDPLPALASMGYLRSRL